MGRSGAWDCSRSRTPPCSAASRRKSSPQAPPAGSPASRGLSCSLVVTAGCIAAVSQSRTTKAGSPRRTTVAGWSLSTPLTWKVKPPGQGDVFLTDPVWSPEPKLRKFVIVALSLKTTLRPGSTLQPSKLWWLEVNDEADTIRSAGRLTGPACDDADDRGHAERFPTIASGPGGETQLVYLMRHGPEESLRLHTARLQFDPDSGQPRLESGQCGSRTLAEGMELAPLMVSADGKDVFGLDRSGHLRAFSLAGEDGGFPRPCRTRSSRMRNHSFR